MKTGRPEQIQCELIRLRKNQKLVVPGCSATSRLSLEVAHKELIDNLTRSSSSPIILFPWTFTTQTTTTTSSVRQDRIGRRLYRRGITISFTLGIKYAKSLYGKHRVASSKLTAVPEQSKGTRPQPRPHTQHDSTDNNHIALRISLALAFTVTVLNNCHLAAYRRTPAQPSTR